LNFYPCFFPSNPTRQISIGGIVNACQRLHTTTSRRKSEKTFILFSLLCVAGPTRELSHETTGWADRSWNLPGVGFCGAGAL
jgi:hypothetical protein